MNITKSTGYKFFKSLIYQLLDKDFLFLKFRSDKWENLTKKEKELLLQTIENKEAKNRKRAKILLVDRIEEEVNTIVLGKYYYKQNIIQIAIKGIDPLIILKTYFHEQKHALQYNLLNKRESMSVDKCLALVQFDDYLSSDMCKNYSLQKLELDANFYSIERILKMDNLFKKETNWCNIIESNQLYVNNVLDLESINYKTIKELINININKAYDSSLISNDDYKKLVKKIKNRSYTILNLYNYIINLNQGLMKRYDKDLLKNSIVKIV